MYIFIIYFFIYCFIGWCYETTYELIKLRKFINRGFMHGPFLPIYGTGAMFCLLANELSVGNIILTYIYAIVICTAMELITGLTMEAIFKVRYWDYTSLPFNIKGYICLPVSLFWGILAVLITKYIHPTIENFVLSLSTEYIEISCYILLLCCTADFALSWAEGIDLRHKLEDLYENSEQLNELRQLTEEFKQNFAENAYEAKELIGQLAIENLEKVDEIKMYGQEKATRFISNNVELMNSVLSQIDEIYKDMLNESESSDSYTNRQFTRINNIRIKLTEFNTEKAETLHRLLNTFQRHLLQIRNNTNIERLLRRNPHAVSNKYSKELIRIKKSSKLNIRK